ncbi:MFS transporter [Pseudomonas sp. BGr12]|uniref:MFS transporter n=1 Tax=Pseudomonas sp. BGr12 TaxID=2936269 RepID=UPI00255A160D|nr:MFS transporter [Pseudomonas sp. BJa5]MDL2426328.1 MFS transporter [Pseudomonas sp. BJa5]
MDLPSADTASPLPLRTRIAYGFASLGTGNFLVVPQLFLLFYMTELLGIPAMWASLTLLLPKLWEFVSDPYIGMRSDRTSTRWGRRHPFMVAGAILLSLGIALVFNVPGFESPIGRWLFVTAMFVLATTGYALFIVPYTALLGEIAKGPHERTNMVAIRMGFLGMSLLIAGVFWPQMLKGLGSSAFGYSVLGYGVGAVCFVAMLVTVIGTRRASSQPSQPSDVALLEHLRMVFKERAFVMLALAYGFQILAQSVNSTVLAYVGKYISPLGENFLPAYFGLATAVSVLAMGGWSIAAKSFSKRSCYIAGSVLSVCGYLISAVGLGSSFWILGVGAILGGIGFSATQVFGFSILPAVVDHHRRETGVARDGAFTGVWVGWEKIGLALGASLAGLVLGASGFVASPGLSVEQSPEALSAIVCLFGIVPAALVLASILPLFSFSLRSLRSV